MTDHALVSDLDLQRGRAELYKRLYEVTAALSRATEPEDVVGVMFAEGLAVLGSTTGFLGIISDCGEYLNVQRFSGAATAAAQHVQLPLAAQVPLAATARDGQIRLIASNDQLSCDFPGLHRLNPDDHACATVPILVDGELWGAMNIGFEPARPITNVEHHLLTLLAEHCGIALTRTVRLQQAEQRLRSRRALEIHDDVIADLVTAQAALDAGEVADATVAVSNGLAAARRIVDRVIDGVEPREPQLEPTRA